MLHIYVYVNAPSPLTHTHTHNNNERNTGSRCVRPPIIVGDIWRPAPLTVAGFKHAQSLTGKASVFGFFGICVFVYTCVYLCFGIFVCVGRCSLVYRSSQSILLPPLSTHTHTQVVKGQLPGPMTLLHWSFPLADRPVKEQALQIGTREV